MVSITNPCGASVSVTWYATGNGGFIVRDVPPSEPLKAYDDPLLVIVVMLNMSAVGHATAEEVKLHSTCLVTVKVIGVGVGVVPFPRVPVVVEVDTAGCSMFLLWSLNPFAALSLPSHLLAFICLLATVIPIAKVILA